jgi:Holliday junction DNA helicase RuvB
MSIPHQKEARKGSGQATGADASFLDKTLRPQTWDEYIGQERVKENLRILLSAAKKRGEPPEHMLFYGPPGVGKTTLCYLIAKELGTNMKITSGPAIERVGDLASLITNLEKGDVLFIDEIHRLNKSIEEVLYPAMESGVLDIIIGKGPSARSIQLELPPFTLVAATTLYAEISAPLRSRFSGGTYHLAHYSEREIETIIGRSAQILNVPIEQSGILEIAKRSRFTPRTANRLLKRCRDFAEVHERTLDNATVSDALSLLGIDALGLEERDRLILTMVIDKFNGGPVGLKTIAAALSEEERTIEDVHEPFLIQAGLIERTSRGRVVTPQGYAHVERTAPQAVPTLL